MAGPFPAAVVSLMLAALFVGPLLLVGWATQDATPLFWFALIADLALVAAFALFTWRRPLLFVGTLTVWFVLQRLVLALLAPHVSSEVLRLLLTYKEGFYMILWLPGVAGVVAHYRRGDRNFTPLLLADLLALGLLVLLAVHFLLSDADMSARLTYARRLAAPLLLYLGGRLLVPDRGQLLAGLRLLVLAGLGVALFGLIERFALSTSFWSDQVDALGFYSRLGQEGLLPGAWIRPFQGVPEGIFVAFPVDVPVRRLVSTYLEPTTLGAFLALVLLLLLFVPQLSGGRRGLMFVAASSLLTVAVAATISRGAMEIVLIGGGVVLLLTAARVLRWPWRLETAVISGVAVALLLTFLVASLSFSQMPNQRLRLQHVLSAHAVSGLEPVAPPPAGAELLNEGAKAHANGLTSGLDKMLEDPGGVGLGAAGAWSDSPEVGGESTVGTLAAQLGLPGLVLWLAFHVTAIGALLRAARRLSRSDQRLWSNVTLALGAALTGLFVTAWLSESASGLLGNAFFFLFAGWALAVAAPGAPALGSADSPSAPADR